MLNRPKYYNLHLITVTCDCCAEEYIYPDVQLAREIPKGEAWSPPPKGAAVYDIPIRHHEVTRSVPFCSMCDGRVPRVALPPRQDGVLSVARGGASGSTNGATPPPVSPEAATAMLRQLGLL